MHTPLLAWVPKHVTWVRQHARPSSLKTKIHLFKPQMPHTSGAGEIHY
jgi:hypothetical protein